MTKPKMAVVRAFPRRAEFNFYTAFKKTRIKLIGDHPQIKSYFEKNAPHLENVYLPLKPVWLWDPIKFIKGRLTHRSWVEFKDLEKELEDCQVINVSDTYYFYCRQCALLAQKHQKLLVVIVWENAARHPGVYLPPYAQNVKAVIKNTRLFVLRSQGALQFTDSVGIPRSKVKVIYKGIDQAVFHPPKRPLASGGKIRILYVGQIDRSKGVEDLLTAFERLCLIFDLELVMAGRMRLKDGLKPYQGLPIKYLGFVDYAKLPQVYRQAAIFCSPSKGKERFSYTLMEAQATGLPIVTTRVGGIPEEVGQDNFLVDQGDVDGIYQALKKLIENQALRKKIGLSNQRRARKLFDLKKQAKKTEAAILSVL